MKRRELLRNIGLAAGTIMAERNNQTKNNAAMFGKKFIVLPNAMYGDWDGALYKYQYNLPPKEKEKVIMQSLKRY